MKPVFRRIRSIRCAYDSLKRLDMERHSGRNSWLYNRIDAFIHDIIEMMISTSRSLMFMYRSSMSMFRSLMCMYRSSMSTFRSWIAMFRSPLLTWMLAAVYYIDTLSLSSILPSSEVGGQNARAWHDTPLGPYSCMHGTRYAPAPPSSWKHRH